MSNDHKNIIGRYFRLGSNIILKGEVSDERIAVVLEKLKWVKGVYKYLGITGELRKPLVLHVGGLDNPFVEHKENGYIYTFNIYKTMFSPGNKNLRVYLTDFVQEKSNLLDMFAAVGNLSLQPVASRKCRYIAIEKNPDTYASLLKTLKLNNVKPVLTLNKDSRKIEIEDWADIIFMGYHNVDFQHISKAVRASKKKSKLFLHPIAKKESVAEWEKLYSSWIKASGANSILEKCIHVKKFSPGQSHYLLIFSITK